MDKVFYLAYSSNLHPFRLNHIDRVPSAKLIGVIKLYGYELAFHKLSTDESGKCLLNKTGVDTDVVFAALYEFDVNDKDALDDIEGLNKSYEEQKMAVTFNGVSYEAFIYMASYSHISSNLIPYTWYKNLVLAGARFHELPVDYISNIESVPSKEDMKESRRIKNEKLLRQMLAYR